MAEGHEIHTACPGELEGELSLIQRWEKRQDLKVYDIPLPEEAALGMQRGFSVRNE